MKFYGHIILILFISMSQMKAQIIDYVVSDTLHIRSSRSYSDSAETDYILKCSNQERINKKYRLFYDAKKTKLAKQFNCDGEGLLDTLKEWFDNGNVKFVYYGKKNINPKLYEYTSYYRNGNLKSNRNCANDTCLSVNYYKSGKLKEKLYEKDFRLFYEEKFYENGQPMFEPHFIETDKIELQTLYYESGKVLQYRYWVNYSLVGQFKEFYENGKLKIIGQYETEEQYFSVEKKFEGDSFKMGKWFYYDNTGRLEKEELYELNVLIKTTRY